MFKSTDNLDIDIREESHSEEEESSSSSDEMSFDRSKQHTHSNRNRSSTSEETMSFSNRRSADMSMPGSSILENIDTPPPFRKRSHQLSQDEQQRRPSNISQNTSSFQTTNDQLCKCLKLLNELIVYKLKFWSFLLLAYTATPVLKTGWKLSTLESLVSKKKV